MKITQKKSRLNMIEEDLLEQDFDIYSDNYDDEEAIDSMGLKAWEAAFVRQSKRF